MMTENLLRIADDILDLATRIHSRHSTRISFETAVQIARDLTFDVGGVVDSEPRIDPSETFWDGSDDNV